MKMNVHCMCVKLPTDLHSDSDGCHDEVTASLTPTAHDLGSQASCQLLDL